MYRDMISTLIDTHGTPCELRADETVYTSAFINPLKYSFHNFGGISFEESGPIDDGSYLYIGKAEDDLSLMPLGTVIESGGRLYHVERSELYMLEGEPLYCRAVLRLFEGGGEDD